MSTRGGSSSPFSYRRASSPFSSSSLTSSFMNTSGRFVPRSCSTSGYGGRSPVGFPASEELSGALLDVPRSSGDSISVTVRFRPMNNREYQRGDEITWYPDGDKIICSEYNPTTAYAFDKVFGPNATSQEVYEVATRPVVKATMEGVNGTVFAYGVTSSGKTHTMHTPRWEFLVRVSYLEIYNEIINDLLDPTGQNLRVREDAQGTFVEGIKEEVVLSPGHALSFIASGEEHHHVGSNNFNLLSSRSHTIFSLNLTIMLAWSFINILPWILSMIYCVIACSKWLVTSQMIESSAHGDEYDGMIFSQLVIGELSEGKASHIPYRDSKLTHLLQSSLSGRGHVLLICTVTPTSSSTKKTHNTLKFPSRAKCVEIYASRNKIVDEKSLIKKYQHEISSLKQELDQLRNGMLVGISHEEIMSLRQQLEEGQVKMQSRLEEEEEAKVALMSRIQRLTKLILVSTKNAIPGYLGEVLGHQRSHSAGQGYEFNSRMKFVPTVMRFCHISKVFWDGSVHVETKNHKDSPSSTIADASGDSRHKRSSSKWKDDLSPTSSTVTKSNQAAELISGSKLPIGEMTMSDEMDLLVEQVKMLAGDIAFNTSTLKRLLE
ncbi:hypothetical protein Ancab_019210 [Ancistrocladus abbreviatus]